MRAGAAGGVALFAAAPSAGGVDGRCSGGGGGETVICIRVMGTPFGAAIRTNSPCPIPGRCSRQTVCGSPSVSSTPRDPGTLEPRATSSLASGASGAAFAVATMASASFRCSALSR